MIESCLNHKIIRDFLKNHQENKWKDLIPILIKIGILFLKKEFNKIVFTYDELKKLSSDLQHEQIEKDKERSKEINKELNIYDSLNVENDKDGKKINLKNQINKGENKINNNINNNNGNNLKINIGDTNKNNQEKLKTSNDAIKELKNTIKNNYQFFKNNISIDFKNKLAKQKQEIYKKIIIEKIPKKEPKQKEKISYAISYDKNLRPSSIAKKINNTTTNNTNIKTDYTTNPNNLFFNSSYNYSSEKKFKNQNKSTSKNKNKKKYLNLNLNNININKFDKNKNKDIKHYNINRQNVKNNIIRIGGNEKPNYYKKLNNIIQKCNLLNNESNRSNNFHAIKFNTQLDKINKNKNINNSNNYGHTNNYFKNSNFLSTIFQKLNSNEKDLKTSNNYFSNREELETFIKKNRLNKSKLNDKSDKSNNSKYKKVIMKSEKPVDRTNSILKFEEDEINTNLNIQKEFEKNKNKSTKLMKKKEIEKESYNILLKSLPSKNDLIRIDKNDENTPKKVYIITEKDNSSAKQNNLKEIDEKNVINNDDSINKKKEGLKMIKLFDLKSEESNDKEENKENNPFLKKISKNRYFNIFGHEAEGDFSLTQIEKDYSGIYDSSSNENQINPDYFFKESPKNIFKNDKSNEQSVNSNDNRV